METNSLKILIVEDELLLAMDLECMLKQLGESVIGVASDAAQAFALANEEAPDLALVDVNLRDGASGPEIASGLVSTHQMLVVFVTGNAEQIPRDYAGALGAIPKPWAQTTIEQLLVFVHQYRAGPTSSSELCPPATMSLALSLTV